MLTMGLHINLRNRSSAILSIVVHDKKLIFWKGFQRFCVKTVLSSERFYPERFSLFNFLNKFCFVSILYFTKSFEVVLILKETNFFPKNTEGGVTDECCHRKIWAKNFIVCKKANFKYVSIKLIKRRLCYLYDPREMNICTPIS